MAVNLFNNLPILHPNLDPIKFLKYGIWNKLPKNYEII